jgi:putative ABC transport system permease protein
MSALLSDLRFAVRMLIKAPAFSLAVIFALALGIGPTTAIYSIVHATLLAPLPYPDPDQLVLVWSRRQETREATSPADYLEWKKQSTSFQYLEPFLPRGFNLSTPEAPERIRARQVSPNGHRMFGQSVLLGRDFAPDEDQPGKQHVVLLKHRLWQERFGGDPGLVGRDIRLDGVPYRVIGILRPGAMDRLPADIWIPLALKPEDIANRQFRSLLLSGRLKPGVTREQAQQEMNVITARLGQQFPDSNRGRSASVEALQNNFLSAAVVRNLWLLLAAVSFVVLIACVNVANMWLSRGAVRERELAVRAALGATKGRLARLALTESLVLAFVGGALGVLSSSWILLSILAILPRFTLPAEADPKLSIPVLLFSFLATVASGLLCGAAQAYRAGRADWAETLKQAGRGPAGQGNHTLRHALVVAECAMAVTLLMGAGLTILSFWNRTQINPGVRTDHILTFGLPLRDGRFSSAPEIEAFYRQLTDRFRTLPGVVQASVSAPTLPLVGTGFSRQFHLVGQAVEPSSQPSAGVQMVMPEHFDTFDIRIVKGRALTAQDRAGAQPVAVVNERFVRRFLDGADPLGRRIAMNQLGPGNPRQGYGPGAPGASVEWLIVGVFRDVSNLDQFGDPAAPQICVPFAQSPSLQAVLAVRTVADPATLQRSLAAAVRTTDADLPLTDVRTMQELVSEQLAPDRLNIALYGGLAVLALILAALGIYGVMSYTVAQRRAEIGLRMALGARQTDVTWQILREGLMLSGTGLVLGFGGAYLLSRAMQSMLYAAGGLNLPVFLAVAGVLCGTALAACYLPARRASALDPMLAITHR